MNPAALQNVSSRPRRAAAGQAAFTMVEIAISLAVIGFALVAIIAVLPIGLDAQKVNRQETIINQDAVYWMEAIRNGAQGLDDLTNYVQSITNVVTQYDANNQIVNGPDVFGYTYTQCTLNGGLLPPANVITNGYRIVGLLSTPRYIYPHPPSPVASGFTSNYVYAYVRALSGAATEKAPQDNTSVLDLAFRYRLISEIVPRSNWDTNWVNYTDANLTDPTEIAARSNYWQVAKHLRQNLHDVRLLFRWPVLPNGNIGSGRQQFRTLASGQMTNQPPGEPWHFFESRSYVRIP